MMKNEDRLTTFIEMCDSARSKGFDRVAVPSPKALGSTYDEVLESLNRLAQQGLALVITRPEPGQD